MNAPKKSLFRTIEEGLAQAPLDSQVLIRPVGGPARKTDHVVGMMPNELKKLHHFFATQADAHDRLVASLRKECDDILAGLDTRGPFSTLLSFLRPKGALEKLAQHEKQLAESAKEVTDIRDFLMKEIERAFPTVVDKPSYGVRGDWSVYWANEDDDDIVIEGGEDLPPEVRDVIMRHAKSVQSKHGGAIKVKVTRVGPFNASDADWIERMRQRVNA